MSDDFRHVIAKLGGAQDVTVGKMFGSEALKVNGKVFSMCVKNRLIVKLPTAGVKELIDDGVAVPFDPGHGRIMKEWVSIAADVEIDWVEASNEAKAFVAGQKQR